MKVTSDDALHACLSGSVQTPYVPAVCCGRDAQSLDVRFAVRQAAIPLAGLLNRTCDTRVLPRNRPIGYPL